MKSILSDGAKANFSLTSFSGVLVVSPKGPLSPITGTGTTTVSRRNVCVQDDFKSVKLAGCKYLTLDFPLIGDCELVIEEVDSAQLSTGFTSSGDKVLLAGGTFKALLKVTKPAMSVPKGGVSEPDGNQTYKDGKGTFIAATSNYRTT